MKRTSSLDICALAVACTLSLVACVTGTANRERGASRRAVSAETEEVIMELLKSTMRCFPSGRKPAPGVVILAGVFGAPGEPLELYDSQSSPGNEAAIDCAVAQGVRQMSPPSPPSPYFMYRIVFPGGPEDIDIAFPKSAPPRKSR